MLSRPNLGIKFELFGYQRKQNTYKSYKFKTSVSDPNCSSSLWLEVQILFGYPWSYPKQHLCQNSPIKDLYSFCSHRTMFSPESTSALEWNQFAPNSFRISLVCYFNVIFNLLKQQQVPKTRRFIWRKLVSDRGITCLPELVSWVSQIFLHYLKELGQPLTAIKELARQLGWHAYPGYIFRWWSHPPSRANFASHNQVVRRAGLSWSRRDNQSMHLLCCQLLVCSYKRSALKSTRLGR